MTADARAAAVSAEDAPGRRRIRLVFSGLVVAMLLGSLDQTIFATALPTIVGELEGVDRMLWVTTAYILAATITMPVYGKLGDLLGRKPLFIAALGLFLLGSVIGALSGDMTTLIAGRAVQGLGGGGLVILAQAIIADVVPARQRGAYLGALGAVFALSSVIGPLLGGWFTDGIGWRWAFWINLPLGALAILCAVLFLEGRNARRKARVDVAGIATMAVAATSLVLVASWGGSTLPWNSPVIIGLIALVAGSSALFVAVERRAAEPIIPLTLFRSRDFTIATLAGLITAIAMFGAIGYMPTYLQMVTGVDATVAGYLLLPLIVALMVMSIVSGQLVSRTGRYRWMTLTGAAVTAVALGLLSTLEPQTPIIVIGVYLVLLGAGIGLGTQVLVLVVQNAVPATEVGTATGANNFFREIGASLGSAIVGSVFTSRLAAILAERVPASAGVETAALTPDAVQQLPAPVRELVIGAYNDALTPIFLALVPVLIIDIVLLFFLRERPLTQGATLPVPDPDPDHDRGPGPDSGSDGAEGRAPVPVRRPARRPRARRGGG